jgi:hypothetical protein
VRPEAGADYTLLENALVGPDVGGVELDVDGPGR